ncbi:MAG: type II secretion system protein [Roseburia sp.]|nr:type II secretion system protein [Roseburia sp.]
MNKLKKKNGFTLIEMLVCTVIMLLVGAMCGTGVKLAIKSLDATNFESSSQMLESTLDIYISDILRHASNVTDDGTKIIFDNSAYYIKRGSLKIDEVSNGIGYLVCTSTKADETQIEMLVANKGVYADALYIKDFLLNYDATAGIFEGSYSIVNQSLGSSRNCTFKYRTIMENVN